MAEHKVLLRQRRRTVELGHHLRLCDMRTFAGTNVWEQVNSTRRVGKGLGHDLEDIVELIGY